MNLAYRNPNKLLIVNPSRPNRPRGSNAILGMFPPERSHESIFAQLCGSYEYDDIEMSEAERIRMLKYIKKDKSIDIDINARDDGDNTPLYSALYSHLNEVAEYLLGIGADINSRNERQLTPLMGAIISGNIHGIDLLFHQLPPPDLTLEDGNGQTALDIAYNMERSAEDYDEAQPDPAAEEKFMLAKEIRSYVEDRKEKLDEQMGTTVYPNLEAYVPKGGSRLFNNSTRKRTGIKYATAANARKSIKLLRGNPRKKSIATRMYYRAKFHKYQTPGMRDAMKVWKKYINSL